MYILRAQVPTENSRHWCLRWPLPPKSASGWRCPAPAFTAPRLTTVRQPFHALTRSAVETVIARLEGFPDPVVEADLAPVLVVRGSTAPPGPTVVRTASRPQENSHDRAHGSSGR